MSLSIGSKHVPPLLAIAAALVVGLATSPLLRAVRKAFIKTRIHRLREHLSALSSHAAAARALRLKYCQELEDKHYDEPVADSIRERSVTLRTLERRALAGLEVTRAHIDRHLLALLHGSSEDGGRVSTSVTAMEARVRAELARESAFAAQLLDERTASSIVPSAPPPRRVLLRLEQEVVDSLNGASSGPRPVQPEALRRAVRTLRSTESSLDFQAALLAEQRRVALSSGYTGDNFAYGSTPLQSWLLLFESAPVQEALRAAGRSATRYVVLGSSLGSLVVYGACVYGIQSRGIELMPLLVSRAQQLSGEAGVQGTTFECADMLDCDLTRSTILMLASQCWDRSLMAAVRSKLLNELQVGALVIDYTPALGEETTAEAFSAAEDPDAPVSTKSRRNPVRGGRRFALQTTVSAPVSWDGAHRFWVWRVECTADSVT